MKVWLNLFFAFFKTGLFTFGGGYAMLPLLKNELTQKQKWLTEDELMNYFSVGQCTPWIIAVNVATFCGYKLKKTWGAVVATLGRVLPSLLIIILLAAAFRSLTENQETVHVLNGIRLGVTALLVKVVWDLGIKIYHDNEKKILPFVIFAFAGAGLIFLKLSAVWIVVLTLLFALALSLKQRFKK